MTRCKLHILDQASYTGPYQVIEQITPVTYKLEVPGKKHKIVHTNFLKPWTTPSASALAVAVIPEGVITDEEVVTLELEETEGLKVGKNLTLQQVDDVRELTLQFKEFFSSTPGSTDMAIHEIRTGRSRPVRAPTYRKPVAYTDQVRQELKTMVNLGIIEKVPGLHP